MDESTTTPEPTTNAKPAKTKSKKPINLQSLMVPILIAFLFIAGYLVQQITAERNFASQLDARLIKLEKPNKYVAEQVDKSKIQAVFLRNGQVYFGKITHIDASTLTLENIYYLKNGSFNQEGTATGDLSLTKLGNEVHSPQDKMNIERRNVDFWENLKNDGKIPKAIIEFEKSKKK